MRKLLWHWFYLLPATARLVGTFLHAYWYWNYRARSLVLLPNAAAWSSAQAKRWEHYFYGTSFLSAVFCQLLGRSHRKPTERQAFAHLAALACFFDDLTELRAPDQDWPNTPEQFGRAADRSGLALHLLDAVKRHVPSRQKADFDGYLEQVFQLETKGTPGQKRPGTLAEVEAHTAEKGACSVLLFRCLLLEAIAEPERQALSAFGSLIQLCDDIFDLWFDWKNKQPTIATQLASQNQLEQLSLCFERQVQMVTNLIQNTAGSRYRRESTLHVLHFLVSITRVCLSRYHYLQKKHGTLPLDNRQRMVVDMARWRNRALVVLELLKPV